MLVKHRTHNYYINYINYIGTNSLFLIEYIVASLHVSIPYPVALAIAKEHNQSLQIELLEQNGASINISTTSVSEWSLYCGVRFVIVFS